MPVYRCGDLVMYRDLDDPAIGIILEMRDMVHRPPDAKVIWADVGVQTGWTLLSQLDVISQAMEEEEA
jgi:hypothetical protein